MDLWPEFDEPGRINTPVSIMIEQASLLGEKTNNVVTGDVISTTFSQTQQGSIFSHRFFLESLALEYRYRLFSAQHGIDLYPVEFSLGLDLGQELQSREPTTTFHYPDDPKKSRKLEPEIKYYAENEDKFIEFLRMILSSNKTIKIIESLLSQSESGTWQSLL